MRLSPTCIVMSKRLAAEGSRAGQSPPFTWQTTLFAHLMDLQTFGDGLASPCYTDPVFLPSRCDMANLTLSVDAELLQKARETAVRQQTSVNALVREFLVHYVDVRSRRLDALDALDALASRKRSRSSADWTRDELHGY